MSLAEQSAMVAGWQGSQIGNKSKVHISAATLILGFGSALNLNLYFHLLYLDRVNAEDVDGKICFRRFKSPMADE